MIEIWDATIVTPNSETRIPVQTAQNGVPAQNTDISRILTYLRDFNSGNFQIKERPLWQTNEFRVPGSGLGGNSITYAKGFAITGVGPVNTTIPPSQGIVGGNVDLAWVIEGAYKVGSSSRNFPDSFLDILVRENGEIVIQNVTGADVFQAAPITFLLGYNKTPV